MKKLIPCAMVAMCAFTPWVSFNPITHASDGVTVVSGADIGYSELKSRGYKWVWSNDKYSGYVQERTIKRVDENTFTANCALHDANQEIIAYWDETIHFDSNTFDSSHTNINAYRRSIWQESPEDNCQGEAIKPGTLHAAIAEYVKSSTRK